MKKFNFFNIFKNVKERVKKEAKFILFTKILPVVLVSYGLYNIKKYQLYKIFSPNTRETTFTKAEEKQIAKKLWMILKYKNIEKIYEEDTLEHKLIHNIYTFLINNLKLNFKQEVFVIGTDLTFLTILPTGSLFISDVKLYF
jgi:hypothetical protein